MIQTAHTSIESEAIIGIESKNHSSFCIGDAMPSIQKGGVKKYIMKGRYVSC